MGVERNLYAAVSDLSGLAGMSSADNARLLEQASREIDRYCDRHFFAQTDTRYFDGPMAINGDVGRVLQTNDILSVTTLTTDSEGDGTFDGETWTEGDTEDFILEPANIWPKTRIRAAVSGDYSWADRPRYVKIIGSFGFGDGGSASPWRLLGITVTADDATETELDVSAEGTIEAGQTILLEDEQIYVSAASSNASKKITVARAVNGTTGAAHASKPSSVAIYPAPIEKAVLWMARQVWQELDKAGIMSEQISDYSFKLMSSLQSSQTLDRILGLYRRLA